MFDGCSVSFARTTSSHYDWKAADADRTNGYRRAHAILRPRCPGIHPAVVAYRYEFPQRDWL